MNRSFIFPPQAIVGLPVDGSAVDFPVRRIYCVGRNYAAHAREMGFDPNREPPFFFCKPNDDASVIPVAANVTGALPYPGNTTNYHHEIELVVAIGKGGSNIAVEHAASHIFGYAVGLDMTRRDLQMAMRQQGRPWEIGKAFDYSAPIGPLRPIAMTGELSSGEISLQVDGKTVQSSDIANLIWSVNETIANLSTLFSLEPGDLIMTGTPEGVGPVSPGQILTGHIAGLTSISVQVSG
ncbi:fumarylacetoacetate hydrolase family protein [Herbaspirillum lusitanum]|uniref:fumarylacetoacetate hydrolase family protein n=1 Tax=Herbaspirillum lusitanum TaxID=213312 RepID=UPI0002F9C8BA|nr:fumarylacetoacetate hydrolase family protein [Herbaspirillum lusitanum]